MCEVSSSPLTYSPEPMASSSQPPFLGSREEGEMEMPDCLQSLFNLHCLPLLSAEPQKGRSALELGPRSSA